MCVMGESESARICVGPMEVCFTVTLQGALSGLAGVPGRGILFTAALTPGLGLSITASGCWEINTLFTGITWDSPAGTVRFLGLLASVQGSFDVGVRVEGPLDDVLPLEF